jgi:hypothetical protein
LPPDKSSIISIFGGKSWKSALVRRKMKGPVGAAAAPAQALNTFETGLKPAVLLISMQVDDGEIFAKMVFEQCRSANFESSVRRRARRLGLNILHRLRLVEHDDMESQAFQHSCRRTSPAL